MQLGSMVRIITTNPAFVSQSYTGVGYRRSASNSAVHGGTPGYNDIRKNLVADVKSVDEFHGYRYDQRDHVRSRGMVAIRSGLNSITVHLRTPLTFIRRLAGDWKSGNFDDNEMPFDSIIGYAEFQRQRSADDFARSKPC